MKINNLKIKKISLVLGFIILAVVFTYSMYLRILNIDIDSYIFTIKYKKEISLSFVFCIIGSVLFSLGSDKWE